MNKGYLPPWLLQSLGLVMLVSASVYWAYSGHQSALIIAAAMTLIGLGAYSGIRISIKQSIDEDRKELHEKSREVADDMLEAENGPLHISKEEPDRKTPREDS